MSRPGSCPHRPAPLPDRPAAASLRLVWRYLLSRRAPAALGLLAGLGTLLWGGAALTVEHRQRTRRAGPDPADDRGRRGPRGHHPRARSATLNAPPAAGCPGCGWPPSSRSPRPRSARWRPGPAPGSLCLSNTERPCLNGWRPPAGQGLAGWVTIMGLSAALPGQPLRAVSGMRIRRWFGSRRVPAGHLPTSTGWIRGTRNYRQPRYPPGHRPLSSRTCPERPDLRPSTGHHRRHHPPRRTAARRALFTAIAVRSAVDPASPRKSQTKSQRRPTSGDAQRRQATVEAGQVPTERH